MGVFKWLRRERVTVTTRHNQSPEPTTPESQEPQGTIRTEEYKRDLAEFQARRSIGSKELPETPVKKKCGRHSLPVSCTDCARDPDNTFNYEKKSAIKYKKKTQKRARSATPGGKVYDGVPNIQFLFQNQVFMPGNVFTASTYSEPHKQEQRQRPRCRSPDMEFIVQKQISFNEDEEQPESPPLFYKNNSLPFDVKNFLDGSRSDVEEVDGVNAAGDTKVSSQSSSGSRNKNDSCEDKLWEVMSELKSFDQWADEQLQVQSANTSKSEDNKSDTSAYGLPIASASDLDVNMDKGRTWNEGKWGVVPVQIKKLTGVSIEHVRKKTNVEINILRKCRHPNIILLMGLYPDIHNNVHIICERCVDSLFGILHIQGRILSAQTSVQYALDIANALVFLHMQGYIHTELTSMTVMITSHDAAKLADLGPCVKLTKQKNTKGKSYEVYSPEPQYVNIEDTRESSSLDCEPLISKHSSEVYMMSNSVSKPYRESQRSEEYRWQAPEFFEPDEQGLVHPCSKSDVYSLCVILWECCNATMPFKTMTYDKVKEQYTLWKTGIKLPSDGTYPGCLLSLLQQGLKLPRSERIDLASLQKTLQTVKHNLDNIEYIIIPARLSKKKSTFSTTAWDTSSPTDSDCQSPVKQNIQHKAVVHKAKDSSTESSEKDCTKSDVSPLYESILKSNCDVYVEPEKCYVSDDEETNEEGRPTLKYLHVTEKEYSSACSTPIAKIRAKIKDIGTPGLHRSDSTEYCSILSPDNRINFGFDEDNKDKSSVERPTAKLSRSFTPKSYKPLHIKVPEFNLDCIKSLPKNQNESERSSYNFDIKNYSLPTTPIARSNKLRKNAWLSGELTVKGSDLKGSSKDTIDKQEYKNVESASEIYQVSTSSSLEKEQNIELNSSPEQYKSEKNSPVSVDTIKDSAIELRRANVNQECSPSIAEDTPREITNSWSVKSSSSHSSKFKLEEDVLANVNVKPLVAIHERWIYEANRKTGRSMSLPENNRLQIPAVKPASHCVDTLQNSFPQLNVKRPAYKPLRVRPTSPSSGRTGGQSEHFVQARDTIAKNINFAARDPERLILRRTDSEKRIVDKEENCKIEPKIDQATDTRGIEEFIRDLIRKEFHHLIHEISDDASSCKNEEILNKGVANIVENLNNGEDLEQTVRKESIKSFSRVKINGNNKPLLQITFSRSGENSLKVLDNCVNVTICDAKGSGKDKLNQSMEDTLTVDDFQVNSLKRCQAFNAIQEARSTEDLYIDDDLSTHMQENFGGKVKLIPLHGSLHEILCEKEDECCLIKVKQESGCDTVYFRCEHCAPCTHCGADAVDGPHDALLVKRTISLIEQRVQRVCPKEKRAQTPTTKKTCEQTRNSNEEKPKTRPKSEIFTRTITKESRILSNSSPSLIMNDDKNDEVEVNIESVMCYQDSSSDECLRYQADNDEFETLERKIEEDIANSNISSLTCGCLAKISEENLSVINEEITDKDRYSVSD